MMEHNGNGAAGNLQFDEEMCERYLFGELTEAEQERFEAAYFGDDVFFDRFVAVKTELLDLYARGELEAEKRARMEPHFLATEPRRERLAESSDFIRAVNAIADRDRAPKAVVAAIPGPSLLDSLARFFTVPRLAGAAALLIAAIGGIFLLSRSRQDDRLVQQPPPETNRQSEIPPASNSINSNNTSPEPEVTANPPDVIDNAPQRPVVPKTNDDGRPNSNRSTPSRPGDIRPDSGRKFAGANPPDPNSNKTTITIPGPGHSDRKFAGSDPRDPKNNSFTVTIPTEHVEPSITLRAGATRDIGAGNTLTIPAGAKSARLNLIFRSERYSKYIVTITNVAGGETFRHDNYDSRFVREMDDGFRQLGISLNDTSKMGEKDYIIKVEGHNPGAAPVTIEEYYFHIRRVKEEPPKKP